MDAIDMIENKWNKADLKDILSTSLYIALLMMHVSRRTNKKMIIKRAS